MATTFRETLSAIPLEKVDFLTEDLSPREIVDVLDQLARYGGERALVVDFGVRAYLLNLLREHLPPGAPIYRPTQSAITKRRVARRLRYIKGEVTA
jgi:hypothetical protein